MADGQVVLFPELYTDLHGVDQMKQHERSSMAPTRLDFNNLQSTSGANLDMTATNSKPEAKRKKEKKSKKDKKEKKSHRRHVEDTESTMTRASQL